MCAINMKLVPAAASYAQHKDWRQGKSASLALSNGNRPTSLCKAHSHNILYLVSSVQKILYGKREKPEETNRIFF